MTTRGIDFARLLLKDALDLAVLVEEEAQERYEEFTHQMVAHHTPEAAAFFQFMSENEAKHGEQLRQRRQKLFGDAPRTVARAMLFDIEAPDYDEVRASMTPRQALETALRAEQKAHAFFVGALPSIQDPAVRSLFEELRDEELEHQDLVRAQLARLPPAAEVDGSAFEDEPVGH
jgi:rubrerythrin